MNDGWIERIFSLFVKAGSIIDEQIVVGCVSPHSPLNSLISLLPFLIFHLRSMLLHCANIHLKSYITLNHPFSSIVTALTYADKKLNVKNYIFLLINQITQFCQWILNTVQLTAKITEKLTDSISRRTESVRWDTSFQMTLTLHAFLFNCFQYEFHIRLHFVIFIKYIFIMNYSMSSTENVKFPEKNT